jgi:hypothetical protein
VPLELADEHANGTHPDDNSGPVAWALEDPTVDSGRQPPRHSVKNVGTGDATARLRTSMLVTVDGGTVTVEAAV